MIIKLDEGALLDAGFSNAHVILMRHLIAQIGSVTGQTTLPEVAALADTLTPIVDSLVITVTATAIDVQDLQIAELEHKPTDYALLRRLDDMQADQERTTQRCVQAQREIDELNANTDQQTLNIADLRRRIAQLEDAQP